MCLTKVNQNNEKTEGVGYKIFEIREGNIFSYSYDTKTKRPINIWIKSENHGETKNSGWYLYDWTFEEKEKQVKKVEQEFGKFPECIAILKVKYKNVMKSGYIGEEKVIVADQILIEL